MRRSSKRVACRAALVVMAGWLTGCAKDDVEQARARMREQGAAQGGAQAGASDAAQGGAADHDHSAPGHVHEAPGTPETASPHGGAGLPPGHPPMGGALGAGDAETDGNAIALKKTGLGSAAELQRELPKLKDAKAQESFEKAFRLTFAADMGQRDYRQAETLLQPVLTSHPEFAPAHRTLGYAAFNLNPTDPDASIRHYEKSVALDPKYGEAHYAIAFMCAATGDREKGVDHYRKAVALGVADERNIGERYYSDLLKPQ